MSFNSTDEIEGFTRWSAATMLLRTLRSCRLLTTSLEGIKEIPRVISKTPGPLIRTARLAKDFVGEHVAADSRGQGGERNYNFGRLILRFGGLFQNA